MTTSLRIEDRLHDLADPTQAAILQRFFKTAPGEYGEGDLFLGIKVPVVRNTVKTLGTYATLADVAALIASPWHEIRLAGFLCLIDIYTKARRSKKTDAVKEIVDFYLDNLSSGNNWDLVDLVCPKILGQYIVDNPAESHILDTLAAMDGKLWHQRVAIVSTLTLIRAGSYDKTFTLAEQFLDHKHDLIHKATGWMLREAGKRGAADRLLSFLEHNAPRMPRTMLRYAIEKLPPPLRHHFMSK